MRANICVHKSSRILTMQITVASSGRVQTLEFVIRPNTINVKAENSKAIPITGHGGL
jgi:hypothetical protein